MSQINKILSKLTKGDIEKLHKAGKIFLHDDHPLPSSRRDFLKTGLLTFSGTMMAPQLVHLIGAPAHAQSGMDGSSLPGFIHVNMEGGFGLSGSFLPKNLVNKSLPLNQRNLDSNLRDLTGYRSVGLGSGRGAAGVTVRDGANKLFANPFPAVFGPVNNADITTAGNGGQFFRAMAAVMSPQALARTSVTSICVSSMDDSSTNKFGPQGMMAGLFKNLNTKYQVYSNISNVNSPTNTGVRQVNAIPTLLPPAPIIVDSAQEVNRILGLPTGTETEAAENLIFSQNENRVLKDLIDGLAQTQSRAIASSPIESFIEKLKAAFIESTSKNKANTNAAPPVFDPFLDTTAGTDTPTLTVAGVWSNVVTLFNNNQVGRGPQTSAIQNGTQAGGVATLAYAGVRGYAGTVGISLGGYDYHGDNRQNQDRADIKSGAIIGASIMTAHILRRPLFIFVTSDGAVGSGADAPFQAWTSDRGVGGSALCIIYDPTNDLSGIDTQLGYYTDGIGAADDTLVSSPETATTAAFYRYLKFANINGQLPNWQTIADTLLRDKAFSTEQLSYILGRLGS